jgi:hypothetical protein
MNKRQPGEALLRGGLAGEEAAARAINAEPWEPLPGMTKVQCPECRYFFAALSPARRCSVRTARRRVRGRRGHDHALTPR